MLGGIIDSVDPVRAIEAKVPSNFQETTSKLSVSVTTENSKLDMKTRTEYKP